MTSMLTCRNIFYFSIRDEAKSTDLEVLEMIFVFPSQLFDVSLLELSAVVCLVLVCLRLHRLHHLRRPHLASLVMCL